MKFNYRQKIFFYFFIVFAVFTTGIIIFEQKREKVYKTEILSSDQNIYAMLVHEFIEQHHIPADSMKRVEELLPLLPSNIRITVIHDDGKVLYDNDVDNPNRMENHKDRPEIQIATMKTVGSHIRKSASMDKEFLYFARHYDGYFVRIALPYDVQLKNFLKSDFIFLYFIIILFFIVLLALVYISNRFGKSISKLKDFIQSAQVPGTSLDNISFPNDELGEIGDKIVELYKQIDKNKKQIAVEREKLLQHFQYSQEGVCFFSRKREKIYANAHFVQYFNVITDNPTLDVNQVFEDPIFENLQQFLLNKTSKEYNTYQTDILKNGKHFRLKVICFEDGSFEININDITKLEKNRLLKQELTSNIAHDLRTPVTSIRGYLETLKEQPNLPSEKRMYFVERAFSQILRLSDLIRDISLITRMEEASEMFKKEEVRILPLLLELQEDLSDKLSVQHAGLEIRIPEKTQINGNRSLIYSIFRNLMDNSLAYAGENIKITIDNYMEDAEFYYFSYYDTGEGIEERHLSRIFDRFYRVNEGRTKETGGSGLGLSIVKNAILFHKGEIVAKNRKERGLEFLFTLHK